MQTTHLSAFIAAAVALALGGCGSSSTTSVQPTPVKCEVAVSPPSTTVASGGGTGIVTVKAQPECTWSAAADVSWISKVTPASGQGTAQVEFQVTANTGVARTGTFTVADQKISVTQSTGCTFSVSPTSLSLGAGAGPASVTVTSGTGCAWAASSQVTWMTVASGATGTGNGTAVFSVAANVSVQRSGTVTVADRTIAVTQSSGCTFTISPTSQTFGISGGNGVVDVTTAAGCPWQAVNPLSWIVIRSGESGTGPGSVIYTVQPLILGKRSGSMTIAGRTFTVSQPN
ncbi:MAG TPA: BACON domain-containing carbohydrate-binding protein [Vicinamibacterales bacterium]|nr:BACON domain-containing carbohydrate-binding protein [Vicinamibacterales bacterium]